MCWDIRKHVFGSPVKFHFMDMRPFFIKRQSFSLSPQTKQKSRAFSTVCSPINPPRVNGSGLLHNVYEMLNVDVLKRFFIICSYFAIEKKNCLKVSWNSGPIPEISSLNEIFMLKKIKTLLWENSIHLLKTLSIVAS